MFSAIESICPDMAGVKFGVLFRLSSLWIGVHWSPFNRRLCVNVMPCVTVWIALPGGNVPGKVA